MTLHLPDLMAQPSELVEFEPLPRAGIHSITDALLVVPYGYIDATRVATTLQDVLSELASGKSLVLARMHVSDMTSYDKDGKLVHPKSKKRVLKQDLLCADDMGTQFTIGTFGHIWDSQMDLDDPILMIVNSARQYGRRLYIDAAPCEGRINDILGSVAPLYKGIKGAVRADRMTECIDTSVKLAMTETAHWLAARDYVLREAHSAEADLLDVSNTCAASLAVILRALHRPQDYAEAQMARTAVIKIAAAATRSRSQHFFAHRPDDAACAITGLRNAVANIIAKLEGDHGIRLTGNQIACINSLSNAMEEPRPSAHMLNGDVGTGKSLTFLIPAVAAFRRGKNVAILAPTGILADQLARELVNRFPETRTHRIEAGGNIPSERGILVGTPGLTSVCTKAHWLPDYLVIDEQHKFSTEIREALVGDRTHVVEATATPIPRSMAIAMYAGMKQLVLSECPVKKTLLTHVAYGKENREDLSRIMSRVMNAGAKVAFIYPAVKGTEVDPLDDSESLLKEKASVLDAYARINAKWPGRVARLYGQMHEAEQRSELAALRSGAKNVLVASSLIEVGLDIPSLDGMLVSDADYFGLSQLHQLRGRLARLGGTGHFLMYIDKPEEEVNKKTVERMSAMEQIADGFTLAEVDLQLRGFGDTAGDQQSGRGYTIFRGINLSPRDFLNLSIRDDEIPKPVAPLPDPGEQDDEVVITEGQLSLI